MVRRWLASLVSVYIGQQGCGFDKALGILRRFHFGKAG